MCCARAKSIVACLISKSFSMMVSDSVTLVFNTSLWNLHSTKVKVLPFNWEILLINEYEYVESLSRKWSLSEKEWRSFEKEHMRKVL